MTKYILVAMTLQVAPKVSPKNASSVAKLSLLTRLLQLTHGPFSCSSDVAVTTIVPTPAGPPTVAMTGFLAQLPGGDIRFVTPAVDVPEEAAEVAEWVTWN